MANNTESVKTDETKSEEKNGDSKEVESQPVTKELEDKIIRQIEYYFGDINLPKDKFLLEQVKKDDGWVDINVLLTFKRLQAFTSDPEVVVNAIEKSESKLISVSDDRLKLRRNPDVPMPDYTDERRKELNARTAYVKGFPQNVKLEDLMNFFEPYGLCDSVIMRHYPDRATKTHVFKGSVYIIFKDIETCKKFVESEEELKYKDNVLIRMWQEKHAEEKKKETEEKRARQAKNKKEEPKKGPTLPKGTIIHMKGVKDETSRENIKKKIFEIHGSNPAYITYAKGDKEGYIRFSEENEAEEFMTKLESSKLEIDGIDIEVRKLEGEEEDRFLEELSDVLYGKRNQNKKKSFGHRKRKSHGSDGGPRSKQERK